jgi:hypothetical protein
MSAAQEYHTAVTAFDRAASVCELAILNGGDIAVTWTSLEAAMGGLRRAAAALHAQNSDFDTALLGAAIERKKACAKMRLAGPAAFQKPDTSASDAAEAVLRRHAAEREAARRQQEAVREAARRQRQAARRQQEEVLREAARLREQRTARGAAAGDAAQQRRANDTPSTGRPKTWKEMMQEAQAAPEHPSWQPEQPAQRVETPAPMKADSEDKKVFEFFNLVLMTPFVTIILFKAMNFGLAFMLLSAYCGFLITRRRGLSADLSTLCQDHPWLLWGSFFTQAICASIGYLTF